MKMGHLSSVISSALKQSFYMLRSPIRATFSQMDLRGDSFAGAGVLLGPEPGRLDVLDHAGQAD